MPPGKGRQKNQVGVALRSTVTEASLSERRKKVGRGKTSEADKATSKHCVYPSLKIDVVKRSKNTYGKVSYRILKNL